MICPHCQKTLPDGYSLEFCRFCNRDLVTEDSPQFVSEEGPINWLQFFGILLLPAVGSFVSLALKIGSIAGLLGMVGSLVSGIICARIIMKRSATAGAARLFLYLGVVVALCFLSFFISFLGCATGAMVSGYSV